MTSLKISQDLCFSFYTANRLFSQFYQLALKSYNLTYTQYLVLVSLWNQDAVSLQDLGQELGLASNTLTPLLKRLEEKDLIIRSRPEKDKRKLLIHLTKDGQALRQELEVKVEACFSQLNCLSETKALDCIANNQLLISALEELLDKEKEV